MIQSLIRVTSGTLLRSPVESTCALQIRSSRVVSRALPVQPHRGVQRFVRLERNIVVASRVVTQSSKGSFSSWLPSTGTWWLPGALPAMRRQASTPGSRKTPVAPKASDSATRPA